MWMEVIHIKAFCLESKKQAVKNSSLIDLPETGESPFSLEVMNREDHEGDLIIVLRWDDSYEPQKSWIGQQISKAFARCGWVAHSTWSSTIIKEQKGADEHARQN